MKGLQSFRTQLKYLAMAIIGLGLVAALGAGVLLKLQKGNDDILKKYEKQMSTIADKEAALKKIFELKKSYVISLIKKSHIKDSHNLELISQLNLSLDLMSKIDLRVQDDFDRFEALNSQVGQYISENAIQFRQHGTSALFKVEEDLRNMERMDRALDLARAELSTQTYDLIVETKKLRKVIFFQQPQLLVPHFRVDHLILSKGLAS